MTLVGSLQALGALHDSCLAAKKKSQQAAQLAALQQLLQSLQDPCCPSYSAAALLEALSQVNGEVRPGQIFCGPSAVGWNHGHQCNAHAKALGGSVTLSRETISFITSLEKQQW